MNRAVIIAVIAAVIAAILTDWLWMISNKIDTGHGDYICADVMEKKVEGDNE